MDFMNITRAIGEYVNGWQVKYKVDGVEHQPFFGLSTYEDALKRCILARNDLYLEYGFPRAIQIRELALDARSARSNTGWAGIYQRTEVSRSGAETEVLSISLRNLHNGNATNTHLRINRFDSYDECLDEALKMRRENAQAYNAIVREYDRLNAIEANKLMELEVTTLKPHLQQLKGRDPERWQTALAASGITIPTGHQRARS
ncbi:MAG: hypothetical protein VW985_06955 [Gammaproteobacteria bacterium]